MSLMPRFALRAILAALLLSIGDVVLAQPTPAPSMAEDQRILPYAEPGQLVNIGGRRINLHCTGTGGPTVILMAGRSLETICAGRLRPNVTRVSLPIQSRMQGIQ
jgi:hypothetical protein